MFGAGLLRGRQLLDWSDNALEVNVWYIVLSVALVLFAGCMSGLTLGLLQLDIVDLEVLRRSGTAQERRYAQNIVPIVKNAHYLLVTLLLCNAAAMEALPIFLDKMVHEIAAVAISVTAVLLFGEIIPQAVCSKHGLMIGSLMAGPVRFLMILTAPISWPVSKLLDTVLGGDHASLFRRKQLKALVHIHSKDEGFGGKLTTDEIQVISGALDLSTKVALHAMTPLSKVAMLSTHQILDDVTVDALLDSKPYSRLPVYRGDDRTDIVGLVLVKELLQHVRRHPNALVSSLKLRPIPRLSALTPMYTLLKLFRSGRAHMAVLTQPPGRAPLTPDRHDTMTAATGAAGPGGSPGQGAGYGWGPVRSPPTSSVGTTPANSARGEVAALLGQGPAHQRVGAEAGQGAAGAAGGVHRSPARHGARRAGGMGAAAASLSPRGTPRGSHQAPLHHPSKRSPLAQQHQQQEQEQQLPVSIQARDGTQASPAAFRDPHLHPLALGWPAHDTCDQPNAALHRSCCGGCLPGGGALAYCESSGAAAAGLAATCAACSTVGHGGALAACACCEDRSPSSGGDSASSLNRHHACHNPCSKHCDGHPLAVNTAAGYCLPGMGTGAGLNRKGGMVGAMGEQQDEEMGEAAPLLPAAGAGGAVCSVSVLPAAKRQGSGTMVGAGSRSSSGGLPRSGSGAGLDGKRTSSSLAPALSSRGGMGPGGYTEVEEEDEEEDEEGEEGCWGGHVSGDALPGEALGIITIEDVIEELMQFEIVDETDVYVDNEQQLSVADADLDCDLPDTLKAVMLMAEAARSRAMGTDSFSVGRVAAAAAAAELQAGAAAAAAAAQAVVAAAAAGMGVGMGGSRAARCGGAAGALGGENGARVGLSKQGEWHAMAAHAGVQAAAGKGAGSFSAASSASFSALMRAPQRAAGGKDAGIAGLLASVLHHNGDSAVGGGSGQLNAAADGDGVGATLGWSPHQHADPLLAAANGGAAATAHVASAGLLHRARESLASALARTSLQKDKSSLGLQGRLLVHSGLKPSQEAELSILPPDLVGAGVGVGEHGGGRGGGGSVGVSGGAVVGSRRRGGGVGMGRSGGGAAGNESAPLLDCAERGGGEEGAEELRDQRGGAWARLFARRATSSNDPEDRA